MLIDLSERSEQPELMDDFREGLQKLRFIYDDINRVNAILGGNSITINAVAQLLKENPQETYTIVDMGCGDGNMLREVARYCRKNGHNAKLIGVDLNSEALQLAKEASIDYSEIAYQHLDILQIQSTELNCDIVLNTLCMHHFVNKDLLMFLQKFNELARIGIIINDLQRSRWAYYLFKLFSLIFIKTKTAQIDGLISIRKAFVKSDLIEYSKHLPDARHEIKWQWAFRYVWIIQPNRLN
jgi:2-polyprenyl-3-methyl-5-hydroxy-6-metoxy-1,4-benzoquinol methylase